MCLHNICFLVQSSSSLCCWLIKQRCLWSRGQLLAATLLSGNGIMLRVQKIQEWNLQNASYWLLSWSISKGIGYVQRSSKYSLCDKLQGQKQRRVQPSEFFLNIWRFFHFCFSLILSVWEGRPCSVFSLFFVCLFWGSCAVEENVQLKLDGFFDSAFLEVSSLSQWQEDVKPRCVHSSKNLVSCAHCFVSLLWAFFFFFFVFSFVVSVSLSLCCVEIVFSSRMCGMFPPSRGRCATEASFLNFCCIHVGFHLFLMTERCETSLVVSSKILVAICSFLLFEPRKMCKWSGFFFASQLVVSSLSLGQEDAKPRVVVQKCLVSFARSSCVMHTRHRFVVFGSSKELCFGVADRIVKQSLLEHFSPKCSLHIQQG